MRKVELSLSSEYVGSWTIVDAIRELFQNAFDREIQNPFATASWDYNKGELIIRNRATKLEMGSLLLGNTTKTGENTIGQFGEGYKLATLVLIRAGKTITFHNDNETWRPRFVKSRRFKANVLTFFIETNRTEFHDPVVAIAVCGLTDDEYYNEIVPSILRLRDDMVVLHQTRFGDVLQTPEGDDSMVFVGGLRVCTYKEFKYSYNFKPGQINLGRDRKVAADFDLKWLASTMWSSLFTSDNIKAIDMLEDNAADVQYLADLYHSNDLAEVAYSKFINKHGDNAVPVSTQKGAEEVPPTYNPIIVNENHRRVLVESRGYENPLPPEKTIADRLQTWLDDWHNYLPSEAVADLNLIIDDL